jgi:protein-tyrosine phosphatase
VDGGRIRPYALFRTDHHGRLTPDGVAAVRAAGLSRILDLRWSWELTRHPSPFAADECYRHVPMLEDVLTYEPLPDTYSRMLDHNRTRIAQAFRALAEAPPGAVAVHCHGGRDRTGTLVALALAVAGVPAAVIAEDYARTEGADPAAMTDTLRHADERYGGVAGYLRDVGISPAEIEAVRTRLLPT